LALAANPLAFLERVALSYPGGAAGVRLGGELVVLAYSPELAERVLVSEAASFTKRGTAFFPGSAVVGEGLLVSDGETWRRQRRLANPAFRGAAVASYAREMGESAAALTQPGGAWHSPSGAALTRDVYEDMNELTLAIVSRALFGKDWGGLGSAINGAIREAFSVFARRAVLPVWLPGPDGFLLDAAVRRLDAAVYALIAERRRRPVADEEGDLLSRLLAGAEGGERMDDTALRDELMTMLVAGQETSAIVLTWSASLLAQHPQVAARCANEARGVLGPTRAPCADDYPQLHACAAVALEAMRLLPPAYLVGRCAAAAVAVPGSAHVVPAGATVLVSPYLLHRRAASWPLPAAFDPFGRWLDAEGACRMREALSGMGPNGAFIPFGAGPRNCIGTGFAMMEIVLVLAAISRDVTLSSVGPPPAPAPLITLRPGAARMQIRLRRWPSSVAA